MTRLRNSVAACFSIVLFLGAASIHAGAARPNILIVTVDTLRKDRLSGYGYHRPTTPNIDRLLEGGQRFTEARVVEPLTAPALASMITSLHPHEHGASRNGLRIRKGLASVATVARDAGYRTAAFVANWTLRAKLTGLDEHFQHYEGVFTKRRWLGFLRREATADDVTDRGLAWVRKQAARHHEEPFLLWIHYVEPHAPYELHEEFAEQLGIPLDRTVSPEDRYDTEVAFVDRSIGRLLAGLDEILPRTAMMIVFAGDHGESLGENGYWGHGRNLRDVGLLVPMGIVWEGVIRPGVVEFPAINIDLAPTVLSAVGLEAPESFEGFDWTGVFDGGPSPGPRRTAYQAHKGAVIAYHESDRARKSGLLEVAVLEGERKEIFRTENGMLRVFDLEGDPGETRDLAGDDARPSPALKDWMSRVYAGLIASEDTPDEPLDAESEAQLRSLGYLD